ncbi:hypothetical protein DH2020_017576 [Rehmannia glutinosa]|uniref:MADS-box domain-containing protein n=1 Tax=Rehmannia glutinosa TaxID=99300 RepID=A0ABR0WRW8_REHGL
MAPPQGRKKSQGRKKIEMKLIADENARTVTFSKRRAGLFKKATELSILCGTQIAIIIFSLGGRAYSFGHPNVESVVNRFFNRNPVPNLQDSVHGMKLHSAMVNQLKEQYDQKNKELEAKKRKGKEIEAVLESSPVHISEERLNQFNMHQLEQLKQKMEKLRDDVRRMVAAQKAGLVGTSKSMNVVKARSVPKGVDLANVERNGRDASPIPVDWLKL